MTTDLRTSPLFDTPGTLGFYDQKQDVLFSADCFGAAVASPDDALADSSDGFADDELRAAQLLWGTVDSPWIQFCDERAFADRLARFVQERPATTLSAHLPPIHRDLDRHLDALSQLPSTPPWVSPDQAALEAFMAEMTGGAQ